MMNEGLKMRISKNINEAGKLGGIIFGLCQIGDGVVRVLSLGWLFTSLPIDCARKQALKYFNKLEK